MNIKLIHPSAKIPTRAHQTDAGWDLYVAEVTYFKPYDNQITYDFGVAFEIPEHHVGLVFPRSSISTKTDLVLSNAVGVIDSGYRGSVKAIFDCTVRDWKSFSKKSGDSDGFAEDDVSYIKSYKVGERAAQIVFVPLMLVEELNVVEDFNHITDRQDGGFGSSGK